MMGLAASNQSSSGRKTAMRKTIKPISQQRLMQLLKSSNASCIDGELENEDTSIWAGVRQDIDDAIAHLQESFDRPRMRAINLNAGYTSVERAIRKIFDITGEQVPQGKFFACK